LGDSYQREKVIPKETRIPPKVKKRRSFLPSEKLTLKSNFLSKRDKNLHDQDLLFQKRTEGTFEDPE